MKTKIIKYVVLVIVLGSASAFVKAGNTDALDALDKKQQSIVSIAASTAIGDLDKLKTELHAGLDAGLTINQIKEVLVHLYAYCGFPRSLRGLQTFMSVLEERKAKGINDQLGPEASPIVDDRSKYERGKIILEELTGVSQDGPKRGYAAFSPEIEIFLKEHLFADIFERDVLTYQERELVTVSVLVSLGGVEPMMHSHMNICLLQGITPGQLEDLISQTQDIAGSKKAKSAKKVLNELLKSKE